MIHKKPKRSFRKEFKRQMKEAIIIAIGFTIAFAWREALFDTFKGVVARFIEISETSYIAEHYASVLITILGILAIYLVAKLMRD
jgi:hypothetical protein